MAKVQKRTVRQRTAG